MNKAKPKLDTHDKLLAQIAIDRQRKHAESKERRRKRYEKRMIAINSNWGLGKYP